MMRPAKFIQLHLLTFNYNTCTNHDVMMVRAAILCATKRDITAKRTLSDALMAASKAGCGGCGLSAAIAVRFV